MDTEFLVMPFDVTNALGVFMDYMNQVFQAYLNIFVMKFIDDILIYLSTSQEHEEHLIIVSLTLWEKNLFAKSSKCNFWMPIVKLLMHVISKGWVAVDHSKVEPVLSWDIPKNASYVKSFLRLIVYYTRFIMKFSQIELSFIQLTRKDIQFEWDAKCEHNF